MIHRGSSRNGIGGPCAASRHLENAAGFSRSRGAFMQSTAAGDRRDGKPRNGPGRRLTGFTGFFRSL
jgi:hypothetical protein